MTQIGRERGQGRNRETNQEQFTELSVLNLVNVQVRVDRDQTRDLELRFEDIPWELAEDELGQDSEASLEEEAPDIEDWASDGEGDGTETTDTLWALDEVDARADVPQGGEAAPEELPEPLHEASNAPDQRFPQRADVLLCQMDMGDGPAWRLVSGISDLLLRPSAESRNPHLALRRRIANTLHIARMAQAEYGWEGLLKPPAPGEGRLEHLAVQDETGLTKSALSNLLSAATLQGPAGQTAFLHLFFGDKRREKESRHAGRLLSFLAENARLDQAQPYPDQQLADKIVQAEQEGGLPTPPFSRSGLQAARERLGLPIAAVRAERYAAGQSLAQMIFWKMKPTDRKRRACLEMWARALASNALANHRNPRTRQTVQEWASHLAILYDAASPALRGPEGDAAAGNLPPTVEGRDS